MKSLYIASGIALALFANISTAKEESAGGLQSATATVGNLSVKQIVPLVVAVAAVTAGVVSNSGGTVVPTPGPGPGPEPEPACDGEDPLVDGVCTGTTSTVTVTASGTGTTTINVPVTSTYLPTI